MADAPKLLGTDTLRQAYPKFNQAIDNANEALGTANTAKSTADTAKSTADTALANSENTQTQLDTIVINGDSSVEAAQARVAADGSTFTTLKERLDNRDEQLAERAEKNQVTTLPSSNIVACVGDSITNAAGASSGRGYAQVLRFVAGTRNVDQVYRIYATGGYTSTQILAEHIPNACAGDASVIHVAWGTNDAGTGVTVNQFAANTIEAHRQITAAGKKMSISLIPPRSSSATAQWRKDRASFNEWISRWAPLNNIPVADTSTLIDPATGHLAASCDSGDGTHPNDTGHARIAVAVAEAVLKALPKQPHRQVKAPDVNLIANGVMGTTPAAGLPSNWAEVTGGTGTAPTYSTKADTSGILKEGLWLEVDWNATTGGTRTIRAGGLTKGTGWVENDQLEFGAVFQVEDVSGFKAALEAGTAKIEYVLLATDNTTVLGTAVPAIRAIPGRAGWRLPAPNTTYPSPAIRITLPSGVQTKIRIGEVTVYNLTALGVTRTIVGS